MYLILPCDLPFGCISIRRILILPFLITLHFILPFILIGRHIHVSFQVIGHGGSRGLRGVIRLSPLDLVLSLSHNLLLAIFIRDLLSFGSGLHLRLILIISPSTHIEILRSSPVFVARSFGAVDQLVYASLHVGESCWDGAEVVEAGSETLDGADQGL